MHVSKVVVAIVAVASVAAGATGGYLISRPAESAPAVMADGRFAPDAAVVTDAGVEQSEGVVTDTLPEPVEAVPPPPVRPAPRAPAPRPSAPPVAPPVAPAPAPVRAHDTTIVPIAPAVIEPPPPLESAPIVTAPPEPELEELVLAGDSLIGLQVETAVTSETAQVEDEVVARVARDVKVGDRVAIPAGSRVHGEVMLVERGGKLRERARLGVRFTSVVLADGTRVPIATEPIYREGDSPGRESATKIGGGAIGGAIIGGILGGAKGAAIGGSIGAGAGSAVVMAGGRNPATLSPGSPVTVRLETPATVVIRR